MMRESDVVAFWIRAGVFLLRLPIRVVPAPMTRCKSGRTENDSERDAKLRGFQTRTPIFLLPSSVYILTSVIKYCPVILDLVRSSETWGTDPVV